jgi:hypothetical protein
MNSACAFIVGIDKYDQPGWDVKGPCANALAVTDWLLTFGGDFELNLFLSPIEDLSGAISELRRKGVQVHCPADWIAIDNFYRLRLASDCSAKSRLLVYWSGHGFTRTNGSRIFVCRDYTSELTNRVFNGTNFLRNLRSAKYQCFADQIFLADVCGVDSELPIADIHEDPTSVSATHQLAFFATPEGRYAYGAHGRGLFTETVLQVLQAGAWPDHKGFSDTLVNALEKIGESPFRISGFHDNEEFLESLVGHVPKNSGNAFFHSVVELLSRVDLSDSVFRRHYLRTVNDLGNPELTKAQGLTGMISELSLLRDGTITGQVPHGLLQFLVRLTQEQPLKQPIDDWLQKNATNQKNALATIDEKIQLETQLKILVVVVENDEKSEVTMFEPFLRNSDSSPVKGVSLPSVTVTNWDDFKQKLQALLAELRMKLSFSNLEIHFVVDPPLFDRPFHRIPVKQEGPPLGEEFVVVLRHRERIFSSDPVLRKRWQKYADALRANAPNHLILVKIDSGSASLPSDKGLCFTSFVLPPAYETGSTCSSEKLILSKLLKLGAPYLYWLHSLPGGADWKAIMSTLTDLLAPLATLDEFPGQLTEARIRGSDFACQATLLWDDPRFNPFTSTHGVSIR